MSKAGGGDPGALGGGGLGGCMVALMMVSYVGGEDKSASSHVEVWVQGADVYGLFDSSGHLIALPVQVGDVLGAVVVAGGARMLPHGGSVFARGWLDVGLGLAMVFSEAGVHGPLGFPDVGGCAGFVDASGTWDVVHH